MMTYLPHYEWFLCLSALALWFCFVWVRGRFGWAAAALIAYLSMSSLFTWVFVQNHIYPIFFYEQTNLRYFSADSLLRMLLVLVPLFLLSERRGFFSAGVLLAKWAVAVNAAIAIFSAVVTDCYSQAGCSGLGNPSIMAGASVCVLPFLSVPWLVVLIPTVIVSKSSIALGLLALCLAARFGARRPFWGVAGLLAPFAAGAAMLGPELLNTSDRAVIWRLMMGFWWHAGWTIPLGTGFGTYHVISAPLQKAGGLMGGFHWSTLHNDWFQMLFEGGVVGFFLFLSTYCAALIKALDKHDFRVALSIALFGIYLGVNPALHHAFPALFGAWLFTFALRQNHTFKESL